MAAADEWRMAEADEWRMAEADEWRMAAADEWRMAEAETVDWEDRLDEWELEVDLNAQLDGSDWVTLDRAAAQTGASRAALRNWYRSGQIPSQLVDGPHGPQRLVPLALVAARAEASPRLRRAAERLLADQAQLEILRHRVDQLELRLSALEARERHDQ